MAKLQFHTEARTTDKNIHGGLRDLASYSSDFSDSIVYYSEDCDNSVIEVHTDLKEPLLVLFSEVQDMNENGIEHDTFIDSEMEVFNEILILLDECIEHELTYFLAEPTV